MNQMEQGDYVRLLRMYDTLEPYHYLHAYLRAFNAYIGSTEAVEDVASSDEKMSRIRFCRLLDAGFNEPSSKIIQLDPAMIPLLEDTEPDFDDLHLPFPAMFINHQFNIGKFRINGFMLIDLQAFERMGFSIFRDNNTYQDKIRVLAVVINTEGEYEFFSIEPLVKKIDRAQRYIYADDVGEIETMAQASDTINKIGANLISLIINDQKELVQWEQKADPEQNKKRLKRGKMPHSDKLVIRLNDRLMAYAQAYSKHRGQIDIRFLVRGHWMRFRAQRYVRAKGTQTWVMPFYKNLDAVMESDHRLVEIKEVGI